MIATPTSAFVDVDGPVHVADYGGDHDAPTVLLVHGLGNSHVSWRGFAAELVPAVRVLAVDLPGHGRTPRVGRSASVLANQVLLGRLIEKISLEPVMLVGHSMGASLAVLQAAQQPGTVDRLALLAPPMPRLAGQLVPASLAGHVALCSWPWLARRTLSRRLQRLGADEYVKRGLELTCASLDAVDPVTRQLTVDLVASRAAGDDAEAAFVEAARSIGLLMARAREYKAAIATAAAPALVVHGTADRLLSRIGLDQLAALHPQWRTELLEGIGHSPHLEAPERTAGLVRRFLTDAAEQEPAVAPDLRGGGGGRTASEEAQPGRVPAYGVGVGRPHQRHVVVRRS